MFLFFYYGVDLIIVIIIIFLNFLFFFVQYIQQMNPWIKHSNTNINYNITNKKKNDVQKTISRFACCCSFLHWAVLQVQLQN